MKTTFKLIMLLSVAAVITGCDKGGGGGNNQPTPVTIPGVTIGGYSAPNYPNESCNIAAGSYTCTENRYGQTLNAGPIAFTTLADLCQQIINSPANNNVATATRNAYYNAHCLNVGGQTNPTVPGVPNLIEKNYTCQMSVRKGDAEGNTGPMQVKLTGLSNGMSNGVLSANLFANMNRSRSYAGGLFHVNRAYSSDRDVRVTLSLALANGLKGDTVTLSAKATDGSVKASTSGFAGTETRLEINSSDEGALQMTISCRSTDAANPGSVVAMNKYTCRGTESNFGSKTKILYSNTHAQLLDGLQLTSSVHALGEGAPVTGQGVTTLSQDGHSSSVVGVSNMSTPSSLKVSKPGYELDVTCSSAL